jgi:hypothetical protein
MSYTPNKYGESFINRHYHSLDDRPVGTTVTIKTTKGNLREYEKYRDGDYYPNYHFNLEFDPKVHEKILKKLTLKLASL